VLRVITKSGTRAKASSPLKNLEGVRTLLSKVSTVPCGAVFSLGAFSKLPSAKEMLVGIVELFE
jgi:hypothetical protein